MTLTVMTLCYKVVSKGVSKVSLFAFQIGNNLNMLKTTIL